MSDQRTKIIIQEINYWKEHHILPEMYCNFLLALYTKGENEADEEDVGEVQKIGLAQTLQFVGQFILLLSSVIVINMQQTNIVMQIILMSLTFLGQFILLKMVHRSHNMYLHFSKAILLVHLLLITVFFGNQYTRFAWMANVIIMFNFICWYIIGYKNQLKYLQVLGIVLTVLTVFYIFLS